MRSISLHRFASTTLLKDITECSDAFAASSTNGTKEKCIQFLRCLKVSDFAVRLMSPVGNRHKEHVLVPYHSIFEQFDAKRFFFLQKEPQHSENLRILRQSKFLMTLLPKANPRGVTITAEYCVVQGRPQPALVPGVRGQVLGRLPARPGDPLPGRCGGDGKGGSMISFKGFV